jgi:hypothetical protein
MQQCSGLETAQVLAKSYAPNPKPQTLNPKPAQVLGKTLIGEVIGSLLTLSSGSLDKKPSTVQLEMLCARALQEGSIPHADRMHLQVPTPNLNPNPPAPNHQTRTKNPNPNPNSYPAADAHAARDTPPETRNPKPETRNPKPETPAGTEAPTQTPKPKTPTPKPKPTNPKLYTRNACRRRTCSVRRLSCRCARSTVS